MKFNISGGNELERFQSNYDRFQSNYIAKLFLLNFFRTLILD